MRSPARKDISSGPEPWKSATAEARPIPVEGDHGQSWGAGAEAGLLAGNGLHLSGAVRGSLAAAVWRSKWTSKWTPRGRFYPSTKHGRLWPVGLSLLALWACVHRAGTGGHTNCSRPSAPHAQELQGQHITKTLDRARPSRGILGTHSTGSARAWPPSSQGPPGCLQETRDLGHLCEVL